MGLHLRAPLLLALVLAGTASARHAGLVAALSDNPDAAPAVPESSSGDGGGGAMGCYDIKDPKQCGGTDGCVWCKNKWSISKGNDGVCASADKTSELPSWAYDCKKAPKPHHHHHHKKGGDGPAPAPAPPGGDPSSSEGGGGGDPYAPDSYPSGPSGGAAQW